MDRIIFGDNQFFGINHMSEEKAQAQLEQFNDINSIIKVIDIAYNCGIRGFMFNTHDRVAEICDHFRANPDKYKEIRLYPSMPYAHKYASAVAEKGLFGALGEFVFVNRSVGQAFSTLIRGAKSVVNQDMIEVMKILVDGEMKIFKGLNVQAVFLQNIVTDLLFGINAKEVFVEFSKHIKNKYKVDAAFNTMNMPVIVDFLLECGIDNPIVCSSINKIGYLMSPDKDSYEKTINNKPFRAMAMSIFASGAILPKEAIEYVARQHKIRSIVFGASSRKNIEETKRIIEEIDHERE